MRKYSDILGVPQKGFHETSIFGLALWDMIGTIFIALAISYYLMKSFWSVLLIVFVVAQILHYFFEVNTRFLNNFLGIHF